MMNYLRRTDFPEWLTELLNMLTESEQSRILHPHTQAGRGRIIQESIINALADMKIEGDSEEAMLDLLRDYSQRDWA